MAEVILNDAESVAALQKETGMELPDTASGRRNAVKDAVAQLSRNEDAKDLTSSTAEALIRNQEQPQEAKAEDPEENRRLAIEATKELQGLPKQETVENVDTSLNGQYNNDIKDGGNYYAGNQGLSGIDEAGLPRGTGAGRIRGMGTEQIPGNGQASGGVEAGGNLGPGSMEAGSRGGGYEVQLRVSPVLRVSDNLSTAQENRGTPTYQVKDTTGQPKIYAAALVDGRNSDPVNGWCVTPQSAQELEEGSARTFMNDTGTVGVGVATDGDIVAVFKNKNGGPKKALDTAMPAAIDMGGDRLDCYGEGLVKVYEDYGFIPVARVEFNPEYANPGWTPDKKTPYIYFMMHNGDSSAEVVEKMHSYPHKTKAELEALPTYGKDDYDAAMEYRNGLMDQRSADMDHGAVGAAERNFSGKQAFNELLSEENAQPDRPGDVRSMEIPKKDAYGRRVSETAANLYGAEVTPDAMADTIQELVGIGALGFDTRSNDQSLKAAAASITKTGWKATEKQITNRVANGKLQDGDIEKALLLYSAYANKDDQASQDMAAELVVDLATMANMTGRNLQLFKLIRKLTPQGQLMATQKTVQRYVDQLNKKRSKNNQIEIDISQELKDDYLTAAKNDIEKPTQETARKKAEIEQAIYLSAASQIKATFAEKWNAWRYMCMLGNVKTNVRNIGGNIAQIPYTEAKRIIGTAFEKALPKDQRTKAVLGLSENDRALKEWAAADAKTETVNDALKYSAKLGDDLTSSKISDARRIFDKDVMEKARKLVADIPAGADMFFKNIEYTKSLAGFVKARGYTYADIESGKVSEAVLNEGRAYAIQEAMKATFNDANAFSDFVSNLRYKGNNPAGKALNALGEGILPFRRTPANVAVRMVENSPANIARSVWNMATKVKNGDMSASTAIDQMAAGLTGTGAMMLGALLASGFAGFRLLGSDVDEDEKRLGHQKYSIEFSINGQEYSYTVDWAAPAAIPLFVGANVYDLWQSRNEDTGLSAFTSAVYAGINMLEPMLSLACLSSLQDAIESVKYAEEGTALYALVANAATSYFTQGIPSLLRQASQAIPENKQQTFANSADPLIRDLQKTVANIPFAGYAFKTDKVDEWGEKEDAGNVAARVFNAFFNPGTLKAIDNSDLEAEINRLNKAQPESITPPEADKKISYTDKNGKYHDGYRLTEEEYTKLRQVQGQTAYEILRKVISSSDYKALTDEQKANVFSHVYSYASERARVNAISDYGGFSKAWMMNIRGKEADTIIRKVALGDISESVSALNKALDENWNTAEAAGNMETAWKAYSRLSKGAQAEIRKEAGESAAGKYIAAREAGVTNAEYVTVLKNVAGLKPQSGYSNVRDIQKAQAVGKTYGLSEKEREALVKGYASDAQDQNMDDMKALFNRNGKNFTVNLYLAAWAISDKESGKGRKDRIIEEYQKRFHLDRETAEELYKIFG
jgi:hypothetical protein